MTADSLQLARTETLTEISTDLPASMWPYPRIIAHRGGGTLAPENTLAGLRCGLAHGYHAVEFDVMLAADGVPVLMHDPQLGRTVAGAGDVASLTSLQLAQCDAGAWFGAQYRGEPVPTLAQAVDFCSTNHIWMNIEIKPAPGTEHATGAAVALLLRDLLALHGDQRLAPLLSSFSIEALMAASDIAPAIARGWLCRHVPAGWQQQMQALDAASLHVHHLQLNQAQVTAIHNAGYGVFCYTVNAPARARELLAWGVDAFCTDRLDRFGADFAD